MPKPGFGADRKVVCLQAQLVFAGHAYLALLKET